jgi:Arc/MetJ-type ribon-helix-helix transcriptional regulator
MQKSRVTVRLSENQVREIERLINTRSVLSASDCIRKALDFWLLSQSS